MADLIQPGTWPQRSVFSDAENAGSAQTHKTYLCVFTKKWFLCGPRLRDVVERDQA